MKKRIISLLLAATLLLSLCLPAMAETVEAYGEPWLTSIVDGMVTAELPKPELKDDFFLNVSYEWLRDTPMLAGHTMTGGVGDTDDIVNEQINSLFTDESITGPEAEMVREYYAMFLDWDSRAEGKAFFLEHLKPIQDISTLEELTAYLVSKECRDYNESLATVSLNTHPERPDDWIVKIGRTKLSLKDPAEYAAETTLGSRRRKYEEDSASYMLQYAGYSAEEAAELIAQRYAFEKLLAPWCMTFEEMMAPDGQQKMYNIRSREELAAASPNFPLLAVIDCGGYNPEIDLDLLYPRWLEGLNECYTEENLPLMRAWLLCNYVTIYTALLDENCYREYQRLEMEYSGTSEPMDDEYCAVNETKHRLNDFVNRMYVQKYCPAEKKQKIEELVAEIIAAYREMLQEADWLSGETREAAIRKLDTLRVCAVYPEPDEQEDWFGVRFRSRAEGGNYLTAYMEVEHCKLDIDRRDSYSKPNPKVWVKGPSEVSANYNPYANEIYILGGILNGVYDMENMSREELLGTVGFDIGHEITHAFDLLGSQYDETGAFRNWWTDADRAAFMRRSEKLIRYYDSLRPLKDGSAYSGSRVQTEAVADLGAMACMLRMAAKIPGFDYDAFFRAFVKPFCIKSPESTVEDAAWRDEHPLFHLRVNVVAAQFPEFQETYGVQPGDGMYVAPEDRIAIWGMNE